MASRLPPEQRAVLDRLARGEIDVDEAEHLLAGGAIEPAATLPTPETPAKDPSGTDSWLEGDQPATETEEEARARELVERIARDIYGDEGTLV
jgi:hypothetical protein